MKNLFYFLLFAVLSLFQNVSAAHANLLISPLMVFIDDRERFETITLHNSGETTNAYELRWLNLKMVEGTGKYEELPVAEGELDITKHLVISPRRVELRPGETQTVRLAVRRPAEMPDGDYHAHLQFAVSRPELNLSDEDREQGQLKLGIQVQVNYSIPVVVRQGKGVSRAEIGDVTFSRDDATGGLVAQIPVERVGDDVSVLSSAYLYNVIDGQEVKVGELANANIFTEIKSRVFNVPLQKEVYGGALKVVFKNADRDDPYTVAERMFPLR